KKTINQLHGFGGVERRERQPGPSAVKKRLADDGADVRLHCCREREDESEPFGVLVKQLVEATDALFMLLPGQLLEFLDFIDQKADRAKTLEGCEQGVEHEDCVWRRFDPLADSNRPQLWEKDAIPAYPARRKLAWGATGTDQLNRPRNV